MTRAAVAFDRFAVALAGALFAAAGAGALWWTFGPRRGDVLALGPVDRAVDAVWWPWAAGGAGVLLVLAALRWLVAHRRPARARAVGIGRGVTADVSAVADGAVAALETRPAVVAAGARAVTECGTPTIALTVTVAARSGLSDAVAAADEVAATVLEMLGDTVAVRTRVRIDATRRPRVR